MTGKVIIKYLENWAPKEIAWQKDNPGIQVGSTEVKIKNILLALDLTEKVLDEAIKLNCNFIITHHPFLFYPVKNIDTTHDNISKLIERLIKNDITVYSAHTNFDFTFEGVSFELAKTLKLHNIRFLKNLKSNQFKLVIFTPENHLEKVAGAVFEFGGGKIGNYTNCSFRTLGTGTFKGSELSKPAIGQKGNFESVAEVKLEIIIDSWRLKDTLSAVKKVHPYEEVAYDVYPLENENVNYGAGAIGILQSPMTQGEFLKHTANCLKIKNFRYAPGKKGKIKTAAVCGGSGGELLTEAISQAADAFITADIKYHDFHSAAGKILFIDAGHYETEIVALNQIETRLKKILDNTGVKVFKFKGNTNPILFYNN